MRRVYVSRTAIAWNGSNPNAEPRAPLRVRLEDGSIVPAFEVRFPAGGAVVYRPEDPACPERHEGEGRAPVYVETDGAVVVDGREL